MAPMWRIINGKLLYGVDKGPNEWKHCVDEQKGVTGTCTNSQKRQHDGDIMQ